MKRFWSWFKSKFHKKPVKLIDPPVEWHEIIEYGHKNPIVLYGGPDASSAKFVWNKEVMRDKGVKLEYWTTRNNKRELRSHFHA